MTTAASKRKKYVREVKPTWWKKVRLLQILRLA